ncbi:uncharacterized protein [Diadema setosum]|uniref:uncharacterized protein n=1 Tax=Diadema setosum TaxID=31175 RepID=UPI003B3AABA6
MPIKSPLYPEVYGNNGYCLWDIRTANGSSIEVEVLVFNMEQDKDYLHIGDGNQEFTKSANTKSWKHWTGNMEDSRQNLNFRSVNSRLQMIFTSDEAGTRVGFHILLRAVGTMTTQSSVKTVFHTTAATTSAQLFTWFLIGLASLLALILLLILLRWLYKKYLKRWINRHINSKYYVVTRNSTEHSQSLGDPDNLYEEILDDLAKPRMKINDSPHNTVDGADLPLAEISRPSTTKVQVHPTGISASHRFLDASLATSSICAKTFEVNRQEGFNDDMEPAEVKTELSVRASLEAETIMGMPDHQSNIGDSLSSRAASQMSMRSTVEEDTKLSGWKEVESDEMSLTLSRIYFERTTSADDVFGSISCGDAENMEDSLDEMESNSIWNVSNCSSEGEEHFDLKHTKIYDVPPSRFEKQAGSLDRSESPIPANTRNRISTLTESPRTVRTLPPSFGSERDRYVNVRNCVSAISSDISCDKFKAGNISAASLNVNNSKSTESGGILLDEFGYLIIEDKDNKTLSVQSQSSANSRQSPSGGYPERALNDEEVDVNIDECGYLILEK